MEYIPETPKELLAEGMMSYDLGNLLWSLATAVFVYVFMAIGMYAIAKRRGIRRPWLAWVPFGNTWLLGCISDQYRYVARGQEKSRRKVMLGLDIGMFASGAVAIGLLVYALINFFRAFGSETITDDAVYMTQVLSPLMIAMILCLVMSGLAIALLVITYIALYDLFRSSDPARATVYLMLSIVLSIVGVGGIVQAIFVFNCRGKDFGMPPRQGQFLYSQPVFQPPVEPWQQNNEWM